MPRLRCHSPKFFAEIENHADEFVYRGNPRDVSNVAWACATLGVESPEVFAQIETHAYKILEDYETRVLATVVWAGAVLGVKLPRWFAEVERRCYEIVETGIPQDISNVAWACATLDVDSPKMFSAIESRTGIKRLLYQSDTDPRHLSITLWAVSKFSFYCPRLLSEADHLGVWLAEEGDNQNLSIAALAFAHLGYDANNFFSTLASPFDHQSGGQYRDSTKLNQHMLRDSYFGSCHKIQGRTCSVVERGDGTRHIRGFKTWN